MSGSEMRVLQVVRGLEVGGLEKVVLDLSAGLRASGIKVWLACLLQPGEWGGRGPFESVFVGDIASRGRWLGLVALCRWIRAHGIDVIHSHNPQPHWFGAMASLLTDVPLIHTKHGRNYPNDPWFRWNSRQLSRMTRKIVAVSEDARKVAVEIEGVPADKVVVIRNGIDTHAFTPACPSDRLRLRAERGIPPEAFVVGSVGRLSWEKNYPLLIRSFAGFLRSTDAHGAWGMAHGGKGGEISEVRGQKSEVRDQRSEISSQQSAVSRLRPEYGTTPSHGSQNVDARARPPHLSPCALRHAPCPLHPPPPMRHAPCAMPSFLLLVGDGPDRPVIERAIAESGMQDQVILAGMQADVKPWLQCMDVFCLSSLTEGTSMTLLEAGACGLPAIVTDVGGNPEVVEHGVTGLVIPSEAQDAMADALSTLAQAPDLRREMGAAARVRIEQQYSLETMVDQYAALYREILNG